MIICLLYMLSSLTFDLQLQSHGYSNIDALDVHKSNIDALLPTGLYRNYIYRSSRMS